MLFVLIHRAEPKKIGPSSGSLGAGVDGPLVVQQHDGALRPAADGLRKTSVLHRAPVLGSRFEPVRGSTFLA